MAELTWMQKAEREFERKRKQQEMQWNHWYEDLRWKIITGSKAGNGILSQIIKNEPTETINQGSGTEE